MGRLEEGERMVSCVNEIVFRDAYICENKLWFMPDNHNGLYQVNMSEWKLEKIDLFDKENILCENLYSSVIPYQNYLICVPMCAKNIVFYDIHENTMSVYGDNILKYLDYKFQRGFIWNNNLVLIPDKYPGLLLMNLNSKKIDIFDNWYNELYKYGIDMNGWIFGRGYYLYQDYLYLCVSQGNIILKISLKTQDMQVFHIGNSKYRFYCMTGYEDKLYLVDIAGDVVIWDISMQETKEILHNGSLQNESQMVWFNEIIYDNGTLWLFPRRGEQIVLIELKSNNIEYYRTPFDTLPSNQSSKCGKYSMAKAIGDKIIANSEQGDNFVVIDKATREIEVKCLKELLPAVNEFISAKILERGEVLNESAGGMNLNVFLKLVNV